MGVLSDLFFISKKGGSVILTVSSILSYDHLVLKVRTKFKGFYFSYMNIESLASLVVKLNG